MKSIITAGSLIFASTGLASAAVINSAATGLAAPDVAIGFEEFSIADGALVTDQFSSLGVTFSPGLSYDNVVSPRPNFSGAAVLDFNFAPGTQGSHFTIAFSQTVSAMTAAMTANFGGATFTSFLGGTQVESFTSALDLSANNFYGFEGSLFDSVIVTPNGSTSIAMDNLSYNISPIPVPAALPMLVAGLSFLGWVGSRRRV